MARTAIFIDGGYLDKLCIHEFGRASIRYEKVCAVLAGPGELLRTYYYHCPPYQGNPPTNEERDRVAAKQRFFDALSRLNRFQVRLGKLAKRGPDQNGNPIFIQKRVDIMLGVDMVQLSATRQIDRAVLIAGDSDFMPAIEVVKTLGVLTVLWHGPMRRRPSTVHQELWDCCDERFELTQEIIDSLCN